MVSPEEAIRLVAAEARPLAPRRVPLLEACGRVLVEAIAADGDFPPFPRAMMDGFAVRLSAAGRTLRVAGEVRAGDEPRCTVAEDACVEILTGAPCPPGTEAVVQKERARVDGDLVSFPRRIEPGENVAPVGSDCRKGEVVLRPGETITPLAIAALASLGLETVLVVPGVRLGAIVTGTELAPRGEPCGTARIRDANGPMLQALARATGLEPPALAHAGDDPEEILRAIERLEGCDVVVLSGGVSVGKYDFVPKALEDAGASIVFHGVRQKPGKPLLLARKGRRIFFGLPGNPLASHFCFSRYVVRAIRGLEGRPPPPQLVGELERPVPAKPGRTHFVPAIATSRQGGGARWSLRPAPGSSSADVFGPAGANAYLEVPPGSSEVSAAAELRFEWMPGAGIEGSREPAQGG